LTPLGDPPLFLGFLKGVPFTWTFKLIPFWLVAVFILIVAFYLIDSYKIKKEHGVAPVKPDTALTYFASSCIPLVISS